MDYRTCSKCGESKPETEEFFRKRGHHCRGGLRPDCRVCSAARDREYAARNRERLSQQRKANRNPEAERERERRYMSTPEGRERRRLANARYMATPKGKEVFKLSQHRRRARLAQVRNDFTADQWEVIKAKFGYECAYCGARPEPLLQEHVVPISRGGPNTASNVVPACRPCNSRKFQTEMVDWFSRQPFFSAERLAQIIDHTSLI